MDVLSHGLWGATILRDRKLIWWAFLSGMLPDLLGSGSGFIYLLTIGEFWGRNTWQLLPDWSRELYRLHHSLLSVAVYFVLLTIFLRNYPMLILPYLLHVLMDVPVHATDMMNRLFYPLVVDSGVYGLNWWEHWWIEAANFCALVIINLVLFLRRRKRLSRFTESVAS